MTAKEKTVVSALRKAEKKREEKRLKTFGLYTIRRNHSKEWRFTPPFMAVSDEVALNAIYEMAKTHPEVMRSNIYCVGTFCISDGLLKTFSVPRHVVGKVKKNEK